VRNHRRWYSIGLPGHFPGRVEPSGIAREDGSADSVSAELFAEILATVIRKLSPAQPVALIGYSTGGFAALNLAAHVPELVASVVSISGFSVGRWHGMLGRLQSLANRGRIGRRACAALWSLITYHPAVFRRLLLANTAGLDRLSLESDKLLGLVTRDARQQDPAVLADLFGGIRRFNIHPLLDSIRVPVLIAGGNRDPVIPYEHTCELASAVRGAELFTFRNVGHLFFIECPGMFQQTLEDWIERHCAMPALRRAA